MCEELRIEMQRLSETMDSLNPSDPEWQDAYNRYFEISALEREEYKRNNIESLRKFFTEHIEGKTMQTVDPEAWEHYSDYHKDVFGYRPRSFTLGE